MGKGKKSVEDNRHRKVKVSRCHCYHYNHTFNHYLEKLDWPDWAKRLLKLVTASDTFLTPPTEVYSLEVFARGASDWVIME